MNMGISRGTEPENTSAYIHFGEKLAARIFYYVLFLLLLPSLYTLYTGCALFFTGFI